MGGIEAPPDSVDWFNVTFDITIILAGCPCPLTLIIADKVVLNHGDKTLNRIVAGLGVRVSHQETVPLQSETPLVGPKRAYTVSCVSFNATAEISKEF